VQAAQAAGWQRQELERAGDACNSSLVPRCAGREGLLLRPLRGERSAGRQQQEAWAAMPVGAAVELWCWGGRFSVTGIRPVVVLSGEAEQGED